ncbi:hypothetical protein GMLC_09490 [Geomonas limicola]|uniref:Uncharacterized protein n=1 Tax=Geomonas limicola TaxID=2740186 RepID=A0A6V8N4R5_9BACT|nr:DUF4105 domain-containing protein [Geomonas limicola]GFO67370.1 hypothetical protein GMLC_09490 [Geomonas limicola]
MSSLFSILMHVPVAFPGCRPAARLARRLTRFLFPLLLAAGLAAPPPSQAAADYLDHLLDVAGKRRLAESPEWWALLHYQPRRLAGGLHSEIDDPAFFLSADGKFDPRAELAATLRALFQADPQHPGLEAACRYPARYHWLSRELQFDAEKLPPADCRQLKNWLGELNPGGLTLVFPAAYLNNPASMFGHTLLRIDPPARILNEPPLLAYTINYAAETREQHGFAYAAKGLFGGYRGRFSIAPYYAVVKAYGDIENRDIWEYRLTLSPEELAQLLRHVWELRTAWFDYYFLDENCSYQLLSLIEVARPTLRLTGRFHGYTIPSETVRVLAQEGLVGDIRFRPARSTQLAERLHLLAPADQELARRLSLGELPPETPELAKLPPQQRARVEELALDYAAYRQSHRFGGREPAAGNTSQLLLARSRLEVPDQTPVVRQPEIWPGSGHPPARVRVGYGSEAGERFLELAGAPAYHDILDPEGGYTRGAAVNLLQGALRYYPERSALELERFTLIEVRSLCSWNRFVHPISWNAALGVERRLTASRQGELVGNFQAGVGLSHEFVTGTTLYGFAEASLEAADRFRAWLAPGIGPRLGLLQDVSERWRAGLSFKESFFALNQARNDYRLALENRLALGLQDVLALELAVKREFGYRFELLQLSWQHYF